MSDTVLTHVAEWVGEGAERATAEGLRLAHDNLVRSVCFGMASSLPAARLPLSGGDSTIWGVGRSGLFDAVWTNATRVHAMEMEDYHLATATHPGVAVWPAVLGVAEHERVKGEAVLRAGLAGIGTVIAVGANLRMWEPQRPLRGLGWAGAVGAAAGAGLALGLSPRRLAHALAIAASGCGGVTQPNAEGTIDLFFQAGHASVLGARAAFLAAAGVNGALGAVDDAGGWRGLYDSGEMSVGVPSATPSELMGEVRYKRWPVGTFLQGLAALLSEPQARAAARSATKITIAAPAAVLSYPGLASRPPFASGLQAHTSIVGVASTCVALGVDRLEHVCDYNHRECVAVSERIELVPGQDWKVTVRGPSSGVATLNGDVSDVVLTWRDLPAAVQGRRGVAALLRRLAGVDADHLPFARLRDWNALRGPA